MTSAASKTTVRLLLVEDNPLVLDLVFHGLEHVCGAGAKRPGIFLFCLWPAARISKSACGR